MTKLVVTLDYKFNFFLLEVEMEFKLRVRGAALFLTVDCVR